LDFFPVNLHISPRPHKKRRQSAHGLNGVKFLSGGTDGQDGPCDVAGAWVKGNDPILGAAGAIESNDSYNLFLRRRPEQHLKTGLTFTNVMDIHILQIDN